MLHQAKQDEGGMPPPVAGYRIEDLPYGKTHAFALIKQKKLRAVKSGRCTIITYEDWQAHLKSLPEVGSKDPK